jgi:hypothetical protein
MEDRKDEGIPGRQDQAMPKLAVRPGERFRFLGDAPEEFRLHHEFPVQGTVTSRLPDPGDGTREGLAVKWRRHAERLHARANELGDCRAGLALAVEAGTWRQAADDLEVSMLVPPPSLLDELAALASEWRREVRDIPPAVRGAGAAVLQDCSDRLSQALARKAEDHG